MPSPKLWDCAAERIPWTAGGLFTKMPGRKSPKTGRPKNGCDVTRKTPSADYHAQRHLPGLHGICFVGSQDLQPAGPRRLEDRVACKLWYPLSHPLLPAANHGKRRARHVSMSGAIHLAFFRTLKDDLQRYHTFFKGRKWTFGILDSRSCLPPHLPTHPSTLLTGKASKEVRQKTKKTPDVRFWFQNCWNEGATK